MTIDFPEDDDNTEVQGGEYGGGRMSRLYMKRARNGVAKANTSVAISESGTKVEAFYLSRHEALVLLCQTKINSITFYCEPVVIEQQITIV